MVTFLFSEVLTENSFLLLEATLIKYRDWINNNIVHINLTLSPALGTLIIVNFTQ